MEPIYLSICGVFTSEGDIGVCARGGGAAVVGAVGAGAGAGVASSAFRSSGDRHSGPASRQAHGRCCPPLGRGSTAGVRVGGARDAKHFLGTPMTYWVARATGIVIGLTSTKHERPLAGGRGSRTVHLHCMLAPISCSSLRSSAGRPAPPFSTACRRSRAVHLLLRRRHLEEHRVVQDQLVLDALRPGQVAHAVVEAAAGLLDLGKTRQDVNRKIWGSALQSHEHHALRRRNGDYVCPSARTRVRGCPLTARLVLSWPRVV